MEKILELRNINMRFQSGGAFIDILHDVSFFVKSGESVALVGQSGSGKSTLLQISALLEKPSSGEIFIGNKNTGLLNDREKTNVRRKNIGFVYQFHNLLPEFTALENVVIPQLMNNVDKKLAKEKAKNLLSSVGLANRMHHNTKNLSGGEQQRTAIARALANDPNIIIADEPTGNLDTKTSLIVFDLLLAMVRDKNMSLLMATHNTDLAERLDKKIVLANKIIDVF